MGLKDWASKVFPNGYEEDDGNYIDEEEYVEEEPAQKMVPPKRDEYRPADAGAMRMGSSSSIEMKVMTPSRFDEVTQIADLVLQKKTVLLNLENTNKETKRRLPFGGCLCAEWQCAAGCGEHLCHYAEQCGGFQH